MKASIYTALFTGCIYTITAFLMIRKLAPSQSYFAIISGFLFTLILLLFLMVYHIRMKKKYAKMENRIQSPILLKINGNLDTGKEVRNANIYLCKDRIVFASLDKKKPAVVEIMANQFIYCETNEGNQVMLMFNNELLYVIQSSKARELAAFLQKMNWLC